MATDTNKLATAAAWITFQPKIKDKAYYARMIKDLMPQAFPKHLNWSNVWIAQRPLKTFVSF